MSTFSSLSVLTTFSLLCYLAYKTLKGRFSHRDRLRTGSADHRIPTQGFFWLVNLFIAGVGPISFVLMPDFLQGIGITLDTYGVSRNSVMPGNGCNAQGIFINIGDVASAWWTFVIALHTFLILAGGPKVRGWVAEKSVTGNFRWVLCFVLWFSVFFLSTVGIFMIQNLDSSNGPFCILSFVIRPLIF